MFTCYNVKCMVEHMTNEKLQKFINEFREANSKLIELEQRFAHLQQLTQQIDEERANLRLAAQNLIGRTEVLAEIIPDEDRQRIIDELKSKLDSQGPTQQSISPDNATSEGGNTTAVDSKSLSE